MKGLKALVSKAKIRLVEKWKALIAEAQSWIETYEKRVFLILGGSIFIALILWLVPKWQTYSLLAGFNEADIRRLEPKERIELAKDLAMAENNARITLAQIIGGLVLLLGLYATFKKIRVAVEGKLTEQFSKAVELLGSDKLDVRLGGIYSLERIARDSPKDHWTVMEVLTAFVRVQSRAEYKKTEPRATNDKESEDPNSDKSEIMLREDTQAALTVIVHREWVEQEKLDQVINLSKSFLKGADLAGVNFSEANLSGANLSKAKLSKAKLDGAILTEAYLIGAELGEAILNKAKLNGADLRGAILNKAKLKGADLCGAHLHGAKLNGADLRGADLRGAGLSVAFSNGADFTGTDLREAYMVGAYFIEADFTGADLRGAGLIGAELDGANLSGANLRRANLNRASLSDVVGLTWEQIAEANIDETTKLPPELEARRQAEQKNKAK